MAVTCTICSGSSAASDFRSDSQRDQSLQVLRVSYTKDFDNSDDHIYMNMQVV